MPQHNIDKWFVWLLSCQMVENIMKFYHFLHPEKRRLTIQQLFTQVDCLYFAYIHFEQYVLLHY